tara:strand:- start:10217 stop:10993 length:777 start_codon:yes stop_codon:yes gene_type:complete
MKHIIVARSEAVTTITLDRPEVMNAINNAMHHELQAAFDDFASDDGQQICVVTGSGEKAFCAGSDLKAAVAEGHAGYPANGYAGLIERFDLDKPVIALVNGLALGGGFEVALACDIIIASENASFGLPEPLVGAVALGGGLHRLARQIGLKQAMGLVLSSRRVGADEAFRLGFVNAVVPAAELHSEVCRWCADISRGSPMSIRASKQTMLRGLEESSVAAAIAHQASYPAFAAWKGSDDAQEGPRAFTEKRSPQWKGR